MMACINLFLLVPGPLTHGQPCPQGAESFHIIHQLKKMKERNVPQASLVRAFSQLIFPFSKMILHVAMKLTITDVAKFLSSIFCFLFMPSVVFSLLFLFSLFLNNFISFIGLLSKTVSLLNGFLEQFSVHL